MTERLRWKDATSYSRDKERIPTAWSIGIDDLRVAVTKGHIYHPGKWVVHCEPWFNAREIADADMPDEQAQFVALDMVRTKLLAALRAFESVRPADNRTTPSE